MNNFKTSIDLSNEEALVLFDFLVRFNQKDFDGLFEDLVEKQVLWMLESELEKRLVEPFQNNYTEKLLHARDIVRDKD